MAKGMATREISWCCKLFKADLAHTTIIDCSSFWLQGRHFYVYSYTPTPKQKKGETELYGLHTSDMDSTM